MTEEIIEKEQAEFSEKQIGQIKELLEYQMNTSRSPSKNEFDHDGYPTPKQEVEILKLLSLSIGYNAALISSFISIFTAANNYAACGYIFSSVFLVYLSFRSSKLAFKALKGNSSFFTETSAKIIAFGVLASGFSLAFGVLLAFIIH